MLFQRLDENPLKMTCTDFDMELLSLEICICSSANIPLAYCSRFEVPIHTIQWTHKQFHIFNGVCDDVVIEGGDFGISISVGWSQA